MVAGRTIVEADVRVACSDSMPSELAEGVGFEPTIRFPVYTLSKRAPSATRPPLRSRKRAQYNGRVLSYNPRAKPPLPRRKPRRIRRIRAPAAWELLFRREVIPAVLT